MIPGQSLLLTKIPEEEAKAFILGRYKKSRSAIKTGKIGAVVAFVMADANLLFNIWMWANYPRTFNMHTLLFLITLIVATFFLALFFFRYSVSLFSGPLTRYAIPEGSVKEFYEKCYESIRSGIPLINPDTGDPHK